MMLQRTDKLLYFLALFTSFYLLLCTKGTSVEVDLIHIHSWWVHWSIMEGSAEELKRGLNTSADIKYEMVEYEILWINTYGFNYQLKWSDKKNNSTY